MHLNPVDSKEWLIKYCRDGDHSKNFKGPEWRYGRRGHKKWGSCSCLGLCNEGDGRKTAVIITVRF